jgi:hypothetical protein
MKVSSFMKIVFKWIYFDELICLINLYAHPIDEKYSGQVRSLQWITILAMLRGRGLKINTLTRRPNGIYKMSNSLKPMQREECVPQSRIAAQRKR